jgi:NTE family protein
MTPEEIQTWKPFLKRIPLFKDLANEDLERVASLLKPLSLPRRSTLFHQGDAADAFYVITSGHVELRTERQGRISVSGYVGRGDTLGELALLTGEPRAFTAVLEATSEFLVLSKDDFANVLRENPSILLQLSRTLSNRLLQGTRATGPRTPLQPKLIAVLTPLSPESRRFFLAAFAGALVEQTRRRVLLVDFTSEEDATSLAACFGLEPRVVGESDLRGRDLHDPKVLGDFVQVHPSGLGLLTLHSKALTGRLFRSIFLLMNLLRDHSDFAILGLRHPLRDVEKSILYEADQWMLVGNETGADAFQRTELELLGYVPEAKRLVDVWLGETMPKELALASRLEWTRVSWPAELASRVERGDSPFAALPEFPSSNRAVASLARRVANLRVGIALGTGAALGYALIGILKQFDKEHVPLDIVAGTSIGSLVGGMYSLGISPEEIESVAGSVDKAWVYENLFWDLTVPRAGFFSGTTLLRFIRSYFGGKEFVDLERPFRCVATDIETGEEVVMHDGPVAEAIRASCGIPMIFNPFPYRGRFLVDGGLVDPVPVKVVSQMGADILVSVNLTMPAGERKSALRKRLKEGSAVMGMDLAQLKDLTLPRALRAPNMFQVLFQTIYTMEYEIAKARAGLSHVNIHPDLSRFSWTEMHRAREIITAGEEIAAAVMPKIKGMLPLFSNSCKVDLRGARWGP